jgi:DNA-binding beta-propeller fold protein YncE
LLEIDPNTDTILRRIPIPGANGNHGLLIEPHFRLAFSANEGNNELLVMDLNSLQLVASFTVPKGPDVLAHDAALGIVYLASESGVLSAFKASEQGVAKVGERLVGANAHTVALDPRTHNVYLPLKETGTPTVLRVLRPVF